MRLAGAAWHLSLFVLGLISQGGGPEHLELKPCAPPASTGRKLNTDVVDVLPPGEWTDKLQTLFNQTKELAKVPIRFTRQLGTDFGYVYRTDEGYVIGIRSDLDHEDQESDIAE